MLQNTHWQNPETKQSINGHRFRRFKKRIFPTPLSRASVRGARIASEWKTGLTSKDNASSFTKILIDGIPSDVLPESLLPFFLGLRATSP